jgi:RHS repeat-associated protein
MELNVIQQTQGAEPNHNITNPLHSYFFGSLEPNRHGGETGYRYGFNGMEMDDEVKGNTGTSYDFGARIYDPRVGRFMSVDPLYRDFAYESNYISAGNNPVGMVDINGRYKYPADKAASYKKTYPMITLYLSKFIAKDVENSQTIKEGLHKYSGGNLGPAEVKKMTEWGNNSEAVIIFDEALAGDDPNADYGMGLYGEYYERQTGFETIKELHISKYMADRVEQVLQDKNSTIKEKQAALMELVGTVLHESVHYGDYLDGARQQKSDPSGFGAEPGTAFVEAVYELLNVESDGEIVEIMESIHGGSDVIIDNKTKEGKTDVIPTVPQKD